MSVFLYSLLFVLPAWVEMDRYPLTQVLLRKFGQPFNLHTLVESVTVQASKSVGRCGHVVGPPDRALSHACAKA